MPETIEITQTGSVARLTLNRPEARNAMSHTMVTEILEYFLSIQDDHSIRTVVIAANGKTFCSGGDIKDLQADLSESEKRARMLTFDKMLLAIDGAPQVTIAAVHGAALGGGLGLVCVSDIAIASESAKFGLPEVQLGLAPAMISPYVIARVGVSRARQLMLTGARFGATDARAYGVVHETCADDALSERVEATLQAVLQGAPIALAKTKALIFHVMQNPDSLDYRAKLITTRRESEEGQAGMLAFINKQPPPWAE